MRVSEREHLKQPELTIDANFVMKWQPQYDDTESDEDDYRQIIATVSLELSKNRTLTKNTFKRVLEWKSPRLKGIVRLDQFPSYAKAIKLSYVAPEEEKLGILDELYGVGVPVASTILHFMYPDKFPIMDVRTAEVLNFAGYLKSIHRNQKQYIPFRTAILVLSQQCRCSLREMDRALFAYDKKELAPRLRCD